MKTKFLAVVIAAFVAPAVSFAADTTWTGAESTDWATPGNWDNGVPGNTASVGFPSTGATVNLGTEIRTIDHISGHIKNTSPLRFTAGESGGLSMTTTGEFCIGRDGNGTLIYDSGTYTLDGHYRIGWWHNNGTPYTGVVQIVSANVTSKKDTMVSVDRGYGILDVIGGSYKVEADLYVGQDNESQGILMQSGGEIEATGIFFGHTGGSKGRGYISGGTMKTTSDIMAVASASSSYGELHISGDAYVEVAQGKEFRVCNGANSTGLVYVTGGALVNKDAWFCVGRSNHSSDDVSYAYLEIDSGAVSNIADSCNFTIGTLGNAACHSEVKVKSGELYTKKILYVGEINPAKMTVTGGHVYANESVCVQGSDSTLVVKGGVIETDHIYKGSHGKIDIRGGTFKAIAATGNYFNNCGDMVVSHNGLKMDTAGFDVTIGNNISGLGGITKKGAGTLTLNGTVSVTGAIVVEEGSLVLSGTTYGVGTAREATYTPTIPETATWTNALEDGDKADPANWTCYDASGNVIEGGVPTTTTAVTIPYSLAVNPASVSPYQTFYPGFAEFTGYASVVLGISGTVAPRGVVTVPNVVNDAIAWYDFDDAATVTVGDNDLIAGVANKGTSGDTLNATIHDANAKRPVYKVAQSLGERNMMHLTNSFGVVSASAVGISGDADRTIVAVTKRVTNTYRNNGDTGYENQMFPIGIESEMWDANSGAFRIEEQETSCLVAHGNGAAYVDTNNDSHNAPNYAFHMTMPSSPDEWLVWTAEAASKEISASWYGVASGLNVATNATVSGGLGTAEDAKIYVGMRLLWNSGSVGELGEAMVFNKALSEDELASVRSYLATKWLKSPEVPLDTLPTSIVFSGENAVYNLGGGDWTLANIAGAGTIADVDKLTVTGTITITVNDDGTIDPLVVNGDLDLSAATIVVKNARRLGATDYTAVISCNGTVTGTPRVSSDYGSVKVKIEDGAIKVVRRGGFVIVIQ